MGFKYKATIEYLGTKFCGWQRQSAFITKVSIQQILEEAIYAFTKQMVDVVGASRTDAGVHAYAQVAHFILNQNFDCYKLQNSLNYFISKSGYLEIVVIDLTRISDDFHARFSSKKKHYLYKILNRGAPSPVYYKRKLLVKKPLAIEDMILASKFFLGFHDFSSFRDSDCQAKSPLKTLDSISLSRINNENIYIYLSARSFLHKMVRNIVGTLLMVGIHKINAYEIPKLMFAKDRRKAGPTAAAHGLYLLMIDY